ncbi:hypothetical protein BJF91_17815 [Allorhizobium taibaishanense]|nr:hypothetical protein BJF91_17815 [Allorhizobium taibaishanense]
MDLFVFQTGSIQETSQDQMANVKDSSLSASGFENKATRMVIAERLNSCARGYSSIAKFRQ